MHRRAASNDVGRGKQAARDLRMVLQDQQRDAGLGRNQRGDPAGVEERNDDRVQLPSAPLQSLDRGYGVSRLASDHHRLAGERRTTAERDASQREERFQALRRKSKSQPCSACSTCCI